MAWFKRDKKSIDQPTPPEERRVRTEGLWVKCESCRAIVFRKDLEENLFVCPKCQFHFRVDANQRHILTLRQLDAAKMLGDDKFEIRPMGRGFVKIGGAETDPEDLRLAEECWESGREAIYSGKYDLVILDEINYTISYKMLDAQKVADALKGRPEQVHVICTGRNAHPLLVEQADLVTEMKEVKHPYTKGILAQRGIDY